MEELSRSKEKRIKGIVTKNKGAAVSQHGPDLEGLHGDVREFDGY